MIHFRKEIAMSRQSNFFVNTFLFKCIETDVIDKVLNSIRIEECNYSRGDVIYSPGDFDRKVGFIYKGECTVGRHTGGAVIPLNVAQKYDSFGILTCFSERDEFPTVITANTACTVLFIHADQLYALMEANSQISLNIISFLTRKINFLNDKIAVFSASNIEEKLAGYILDLQKQHKELQFDFNKKKSAEALNCGRASLYRAIDALKDAGYITLDNKKIIINDLNGLERITK